MIDVRIRKSLGAFALDAAFTAGAGVTVLFGASGAGKTLTLDSIAGFAVPDEGRILLDDAILFDGAARVNLAPQQRHCGYVFQNYALFPHMTLRANLEFAAARLPRLERHRRVGEMIERFKLHDVAGRRPSEVSGGQQQRCSIARAMIGQPRILLMDEPARGLDATLRADLYEALRQVSRDFNTPVLLVTHDLTECFEVGDRMIVLREGRVAQAGPPNDVAARPASAQLARLLGLHNLLDAEITFLDPQNNRSRLRVGEHEFAAQYLPGHLRGDRVTIAIRYADVRIRPREIGPANGALPGRVNRVTERPATVLVEFDGGVAAEVSRERIEDSRPGTEWWIEFPPAAVHALPGGPAGGSSNGTQPR